MGGWNRVSTTSGEVHFPAGRIINRHQEANHTPPSIPFLTEAQQRHCLKVGACYTSKNIPIYPPGGLPSSSGCPRSTMASNTHEAALNRLMDNAPMTRWHWWVWFL